MFWEVNFNFWTISPDRSVPCFSCLGFPHFLLILVSVFHLGASVKCPVSLDVCEWDPKEVAEVVCLERAANQRLHRSDVGEFANCWPLRNSQMPVSVFHSGVFQLLQKMLVYSAVLGEGQLQPREGGGDLSIRYVGTSRFQSRGLPAPPLFLVSLSSSPVLSSSARGDPLRLLWGRSSHEWVESRRGVGSPWHRPWSFTPPPSLLPWDLTSPQLCLFGVLSPQMGHWLVSHWCASFFGHLIFSFFCTVWRFCLSFPSSKIFLTSHADSSPVLSSFRVYICFSPLLSFS